LHALARFDLIPSLCTDLITRLFTASRARFMQCPQLLTTFVEVFGRERIDALIDLDFVHTVCRQLDESQWEMRDSAIELLAIIRGRWAIGSDTWQTMLLMCSMDSSNYVRASAIGCLASKWPIQGSDEERQLLAMLEIRAVDDGDPEPRMASLRVLLDAMPRSAVVCSRVVEGVLGVTVDAVDDVEHRRLSARIAGELMALGGAVGEQARRVLNGLRGDWECRELVDELMNNEDGRRRPDGNGGKMGIAAMALLDEMMRALSLEASGEEVKDCY